MNAYVDQNFLINCTNDSMLTSKAVAIARAGVRFVLSPWHFYEIGKLETSRAEVLVRFAEALKPAWILERSDLQVAEFKHVWNKFYGFPEAPFAPITSLEHVASVLLRKSAAELSHIRLRDFVHTFATVGHESITSVLGDQETIAKLNQESFHEGKITREAEDRIQFAYGVLMLARQKETSASEHELRARLDAIQRNTFTTGLLRHFIRQGEFDKLRAWQIESELTNYHHAGTAKLNHHRQIDRQHAISALAYCDLFITDDKELTKLCTYSKSKVSFMTASVHSAEQFLTSFSSSQASE